MPITINAKHTLKAEGLQGSVYGDIELLQMKSKQWWRLEEDLIMILEELQGK